ncbi:T-complex protein 1 subunit theta [Coemansia sp. S680]|nr:T-complex protein 1 subunit theta [Coemansia sp. S680]
MALRVPQAGGPQLFKEGYKNLQGLEEVILRNIAATKEMSEITRTSFGPQGRNKMVVNHLGKLIVTSDAATIIRELEVVHPAAKLLVMASQQQEAEAGDGTNTVLIFGSELLQRAEPLLRMGLHPSEIARGYEAALVAALEGLETLATDSVGNWNNSSEVLKAVRSAVAAKQYGQEAGLSALVAEAVLAAMPAKDASRFNVDNVRVVKVLGGSLAQSRVVHGMVFPTAPVTSVRRAQCVRVAVFACAVDVGQTETKGTVLLHTAGDLLAYTKGEEAQMDAAMAELHEAGVGAIICGSGVFARTLADNAGVDSTALVAMLIAAHHKEGGKPMGFDVESDHEPCLIDAQAKGILDPMAVKQWALRYATHAALTVLQVDQIVMAKTAGGPKLPKQQAGHWDNDD